ncbi:MAG: flagellar motor protein MotB [Clostridiales bacterium]|nr:flagellar motor protein MotB [Clostridiales bacterium]
MKILARKKREEASSGGNAPWLNTFADLMNLLLCFFVMLFAMSEVDAEKFQELAISMSNSIGIFDGGGKSFGDGPLISSGMTQLNNLDQYTINMGKQGHETKIENEGEYDPTTKENTIDSEFDGSLSQAFEIMQDKMEEVSGEMYGSVEALTEEYNLGDYVELSIDPEFRYVQLSMKGSILFESGKADIIDDAKPILAKIGDLLANFEGYIIEIIGHTDNVPMTSPTFKDNNWLSSARALNAADFLINNNKLDPQNVKYSGRGEYEPIADNNTSAGRAKNRRIEIRIFNEYSGR